MISFQGPVWLSVLSHGSPSSMEKLDTAVISVVTIKKNTNKVVTLFPSVLLLNRAFLCYSEVIWRRKRNVTLQKRFAEKR